jgi:hypothetical protein
MRAKPISVGQILLSTMYTSSRDRTQYQRRTVEAHTVGLKTLKHIVGEANLNKYYDNGNREYIDSQ